MTISSFTDIMENVLGEYCGKWTKFGIFQLLNYFLVLITFFPPVIELHNCLENVQCHLWYFYFIESVFLCRKVYCISKKHQPVSLCNTCRLRGVKTLCYKVCLFHDCSTSGSWQLFDKMDFGIHNYVMPFFLLCTFLPFTPKKLILTHQ